MINKNRRTPSKANKGKQPVPKTDTDRQLPSKPALKTDTDRQLPSKPASTKPSTPKTRKRKRKAGGVIFSIILILGSLATIFWFGWIQFRIEEGEYAVVYTKSHGYEKEPVPYGKFAWRWEALLPTNLSIHKFKINTRTLKINQSGSLPSANYYSGVIGGNVDFTWKVQANLVYSINPKLLPSMVEKNGPDIKLESYYDNFESQINSAINNATAQLIDNSSALSGFSNPINTFRESLLNNIRENSSTSSSVIISELNITGLSLPDLSLYAQARETANTILENRKETLLDIQALSLQEEDATDSRLKLLREYGDIITKYPALIDLFALDGNPAASLLPPTGEPQ